VVVLRQLLRLVLPCGTVVLAPRVPSPSHHCGFRVSSFDPAAVSVVLLALILLVLVLPLLLPLLSLREVFLGVVLLLLLLLLLLERLLLLHGVLRDFVVARVVRAATRIRVIRRRRKDRRRRVHAVAVTGTPASATAATATANAAAAAAAAASSKSLPLLAGKDARRNTNAPVGRS
jgi:hypothetical protein